MGQRRRPSTIDRQPEEIRVLIGQLRQNGCTIDMIMTKLSELDVDVSRSAVGRHVRKLADVGERMRRSRDMATALVDRFGDKTDNRLARLNLELMHSIVMETITAAAEDEDGNAQPVTFDPEQVMFLGRALKDLASAQKTDAERTLKEREQMAKEAAKAVDKVAERTPGGLTRDTVDAIKAEILGLPRRVS